MKKAKSSDKPVIRLARAYDVADRARGYRVLVDRIWPRGVTKASLALDEWAKDLAPSTALRLWFNRDPARWDEFQQRYRRELAAQAAAIAGLWTRTKGRPMLLIYGARDQEHNNAVALRSYLLEHTQ